MPVVLTYGGWAGGRAYVHMITKISRMGRLPHFLRYGATLAREVSKTVHTIFVVIVAGSISRPLVLP